MRSKRERSHRDTCFLARSVSLHGDFRYPYAEDQEKAVLVDTETDEKVNPEVGLGLLKKSRSCSKLLDSAKATDAAQRGENQSRRKSTHLGRRPLSSVGRAGDS